MSGLNFNNDFDGRKPSLQKPGVFAAVLLGVTITNITDKEGNIKFQDVLQFEFDIPSEGIGYTHTEFPVKDTEPTTTLGQYDEAQQKKLSGVYSRIGHILKHYVPQELLIHKEISEKLTWRGFLDLYAPAFAQANTGAELGSPVKYIKVLGSVYAGKARIGFPNYIPFIGETEASVAFGPKEISGNAEWAQFQANSAAAESDPMAAALGGGPADSNLNFTQNSPSPF